MGFTVVDCRMTKQNALIIGISLVVGLGLLGLLLGRSAVTFKSFDRTVTVKGLSEREVAADVVIWPIQFTVASNDLGALYRTIDSNTSKVRSFLVDQGVTQDEITVSVPAITDKSAQQWGDAGGPFRYTAVQNVTVYSEQVALVREIMSGISALGQEGIVISGDNYQSPTEYLFTGLNELRPEMIEEATRSARAVAQKFASDSESVLGKIRNASQGQFSIVSRDNNNPHIKKVRVVSTVTYYLSD